MSHDVRLIDANKLIRWIETNKANTNPLEHNTRATYAECITMVNSMETIDAEPVRHGRWETKVYTTESDGWITEYREEVCSECGEGQIGISNYCPNCGAKMDLEEEDK